MKASDEQDKYRMEMKLQFLNGFEKSVEKGTFAHYEQMFHFPQCFQRSCTTEAYKGAYYEWDTDLDGS